MIRFLLSLFLFLCTNAAFAQFTPITVTGKVTSALSRYPIEKARVLATWEVKMSKRQYLSCETDANGVFICHFPKNAHNHHISISAKNYFPVSLIPSNTLLAVALESDRTYSVRGIITREDNTPIANASISVMPDNTRFRSACRACDTWSDVKGTFSIPAVPSSIGTCQLHVLADTYVYNNDSRISPEIGDSFVTIALEDGITVTGTARFSDYTPPEGIRIWARQIKPEEYEKNYYLLRYAPFDPIPGCVTYVKADGTYKLNGLPLDGFFSLHADHPSAVTAIYQPDAGSKYVNKSIYFILEKKSAWIVLNITDPLGSKITNVHIETSFRTAYKGLYTMREGRVYYTVLPDKRLCIGPTKLSEIRHLKIMTPRFMPLVLTVGDLIEGTNTFPLQLQPIAEIALHIKESITRKPLSTAYALHDGEQIHADSNGIIHVTCKKPLTVDIHAPGYVTMSKSINPHDNYYEVYMGKPFAAQVHVYTADGTKAIDGKVKWRFENSRTEYTENIENNGVAYFTPLPLLSYTARVCVTKKYSDAETASHIQYIPHALEQVNISLTQSVSATLNVELKTKQFGTHKSECKLIYKTPGTYNSIRYDSLQRTFDTITWTFTDIPTGKYEIVVSNDKYIPMTTNVVVTNTSPPAIVFNEKFTSYRNIQIYFRPPFDPELLKHFKVRIIYPEHPERNDEYAERNGFGFVCKSLYYDQTNSLNVELIFLTTNILLKATPTEQDSLYIDLPKCGTISFTLKYPEKYKAEHIIYIYSSTDYLNFYDTFLSLPNIPYGTYEIPLVVDNYGMTNLSIVVTNSQTELGEIHIQPSKQVHVRGRFSPVLKVKKIEYYQLGKSFTARMKNDGSFEFTNVWPHIPLEIYNDIFKTNIYVPKNGLDFGTLKLE